MRMPIVIAVCCLAGPAMAGEFVAIGHVTQQTLRPYGAPQCPPTCPSATADTQIVCVTNACGCGEAEVVIDQVLIGKRVPKVSVKYTLGEWCQPEFPISNPKVLIRLTGNDRPEWGQVQGSNSKDSTFYTKRFERIGSVQVSSLKQKNGWASLRELEAKLGL